MKPYNLFGVILVVLGFMGPHPVAAQTPDSLDRYLETAAKNNPGLNADFLAYKASLEKVPQAGAWPAFDPGSPKLVRLDVESSVIPWPHYADMSWFAGAKPPERPRGTRPRD